MLAKSKIAISFAEQETFGYAMLEALTFDCVPVVPNKLSYKEMAWYPMKFANYDEAKKMVVQLMEKGHSDISSFRSIAKEYLAPKLAIRRIMKNL